MVTCGNNYDTMQTTANIHPILAEATSVAQAAVCRPSFDLGRRSAYRRALAGRHAR
jgi:hypothetical protein